MTNSFTTQQNFWTLGKKIKNFGVATVIIYILMFFIGILVSFSTISTFYPSHNINSTINSIQSMFISIQWVTAISVVILDIYIIRFLIQLNSVNMQFGRPNDNSKKITMVFSLAIILEIIVILIVFKILDDFFEELMMMRNSSSITESQINRFLENYEDSLIFTEFLSFIPIICRILAYNMLQDDFSRIPLYGQRANNYKKRKIIDGVSKAKIGECLIIGSEIMTTIIPEIPFIGFISLIGTILVIVGLINTGNGLLKYTYSTSQYNPQIKIDINRDFVPNNQNPINPSQEHQPTIESNLPTPFGHNRLGEIPKTTPTYISPNHQTPTYIEKISPINFCNQCGSKIQDSTSKFCPKCGSKL